MSGGVFKWLGSFSLIASFYGRVPMLGYSSLHQLVSKLVVGDSKRATYRGADSKGRVKHRSMQLLGRQLSRAMPW